MRVCVDCKKFFTQKKHEHKCSVCAVKRTPDISYKIPRQRTCRICGKIYDAYGETTKKCFDCAGLTEMGTRLCLGCGKVKPVKEFDRARKCAHCRGRMTLSDLENRAEPEPEPKRPLRFATMAAAEEYNRCAR